MNINSLEEYYTFLEQNTSERSVDANISNLLRNLRDAETDAAIKRKIHLELLISDFSFDEGKYLPFTSITLKDGSVQDYPSYSEFTLMDYEYITERASTVNNDYLIAHYNTILWNSPIKNNENRYNSIKIALDAYYRILNNFNSVQKVNEYEYFEIFKNALALAFMSKYKIEDIKSIFRKWLFEKELFSRKMKIILLRYLVEQPKIDKGEFRNTLEFIRNYGLEKMNSNKDSSWSVDIFQVGLRVAQRLGEESKIWEEYIGDSYVAMAAIRKNEDAMIKMDFYRKAIVAFKSAGANEKVEKTENTLSQTKENLKLNKVSIPIPKKDIEYLNKCFREISDEILDKTPDEIYEHLISDPRIFPTKKAIENLAEKDKSSFLNFVTKIQFDNNKNISKVGDETEKEAFFQNYSFLFRYNIPIIHSIFYDGFKKGKVNYETLITYLKNNSWLVQELSVKDSAGELVKYDWISVLAPGLHNYFSQVEFELNTSSPANFVLSVDSLTLKIEGILREIAKICRVSTSTTGRDGVTREKYIEDLLSEDAIIKFLGENNINFLLYFFTKNGQNIRNNIAHSFYKAQNYSSMIVPILICGLLKLGAFKLKSEVVQNSEAINNE